MAITVGAILASVARDIDETYQRLRKGGLNLTIPEVEITLRLEVQLDGEPEDVKAPTQKPIDKPSLVPRPGTTEFLKQPSRFVMDEKTLASKGLVFRTIASAVAPEQPSQSSPGNLEIRFSFVPEENEGQ